MSTLSIPVAPFPGDDTLPAAVDVVIVGGGIIGVTTALELAERGISVALCEKGVIAGEQSSRNWGWTRQMGRDERELPLCMHSVEMWSQMNERIGRDTGWRRTGISYLSYNRRDLKGWLAWEEIGRRHGLDARMLSQAEIAEKLPGNNGGILGVLHTASDGRAEPWIAVPAIAEAAFALGANEVSGVVPGAFGPILLRVSEIVPERVSPFEDVAATIRNELAMDEANRVLLDVHDAYEDARAGGDSMAEAAAKQRLRVVTVEAVDRGGRTPEGTILTDLPQSSELLREVFEAEVGMENPPINIGSSGFLFYEVDAVTPARDRTLDEVRDRVAADWTANEAETRLAARAAEVERALAGGRPIAELAAELGVEVQTRRGLKRDGTDADLGQTGIAAAFGVARGGTGVAAGASGDTQIVFRVTDVVHPMDAGPDSVPQEIRTRFAGGLADDLLDQLVTRLQGQYDVTVDRGAIQQALSF